jgi:methyl-accepting chemotaxis protein
MAQGRLDQKVDGDYEGQYAVIKNSVNGTMDVLSAYIKEISDVLDQMSLKNFDLEITNEYIGDFAPIKSSLNNILSTFSEVLGEINSSAEQVASGARVISDSSMNLAQGATQQAGAIEQLMITVDTITRQTKQNAQNAGKASESLNGTKNSAVEGNAKMQAMLGAMDQINESSVNISKAISMIDSISLQTNMLALNAAVESAKAGQYGKGFTVVAEDVRMLANRSKNAAAEIAGLIQQSVDNVADGKRIADETAETLRQIVSQLTGVSDLVGEVAQSSVKQEASLQVINDGISQISEVAQTNTATSEEGASSSQQLYSQSEVFKNMASKFKLKGSKGAGAPAGKNDDAKVREPRLGLDVKPLPRADVKPRPVNDVKIERDVTLLPEPKPVSKPAPALPTVKPAPVREVSRIAQTKPEPETKPVRPVQTVQTNRPTQPKPPAQPERPASPVRQAQSVQPVQANRPVRPELPVRPVRPVPPAVKPPASRAETKPDSSKPTSPAGASAEPRRVSNTAREISRNSYESRDFGKYS